MNMYNTAGYGELLRNRGAISDALSKLGVQLAVCSVWTRGYAAGIAQSTGGNTDAILSELTSNLLSNARMVPAGIVALNRAQERGYSLMSCEHRPTGTAATSRRSLLGTPAGVQCKAQATHFDNVANCIMT